MYDLTVVCPNCHAEYSATRRPAHIKYGDPWPGLCLSCGKVVNWIVPVHHATSHDGSNWLLPKQEAPALIPPTRQEGAARNA
ncbi:MAG: hypothetical protein ACJ8C4_05680 [Gemmataceae bacterium]